MGVDTAGISSDIIIREHFMGKLYPSEKGGAKSFP